MAKTTPCRPSQTPRPSGCGAISLDVAGLPVPTTYEEYLGAAQALHGKDGVIGVSSGVGTVPQLTLQYFTPYIHQSGWDYFDYEGAVTFDQPARCSMPSSASPS